MEIEKAKISAFYWVFYHLKYNHLNLENHIDDKIAVTYLVHNG